MLAAPTKGHDGHGKPASLGGHREGVEDHGADKGSGQVEEEVREQVVTAAPQAAGVRVWQITSR